MTKTIRRGKVPPAKLLLSSNSLGYNINNFKILFFPFINYKDIFGLLLNGKATKIQLFIGIFTLSHPDNAFQVNELITPLHIVPEWYFLLVCRRPTGMQPSVPLVPGGQPASVTKPRLSAPSFGDGSPTSNRSSIEAFNIFLCSGWRSLNRG